MRRIALVFAFAFFLLGIDGCEAGSITYSSGTITVVGFNESSPCTFEDIYQADVANGWNVVKKQDSNQYEITCVLQIGDGTNETWFADTNKEVSFTGTVAGIDIENEGHFRLGKIIDETNRTTTNGCYLYLASPYGYNLIRLYGNGVLELFSSTLNGNDDIKIEMNSNGNRINIWNSLLLRTYTSANNGIAKADLYRVTVQQTSGILLNFTYGEDIMITDSNVGLRLSNVVSPITISNVRMVNEETSISCSWVDASVYIINTECKWIFKWTESSNKVYRQYTFTLKVVDENGNPISDAKVSVYNRSGCLEFEDITDANGRIPTHIITRGYYDQAHGSELVDFSPHTLVIEKGGYETYKTQFTPTKAIEAIDWQISLKKIYVIEMVEERRKGESDIGEGLVLGFGFGVVLLVIAFFVVKGGGRE